MSFTNDEKDYLTELFKLDETTKENVIEKLRPHVYEFLSQNGNLGTIVDKGIFRTKNTYRPYDSVTITKFLTENFDIAETISDVAGNITGSFLIYVDFHFLFLCNPDQNEMEEFKFQFASKASAINETYKIVTMNDYRALEAEFKNKSYSDLLNDAFVHHVDLYEYHESGLRPYQLLSLVIHVQKFPE